MAVGTTEYAGPINIHVSNLVPIPTQFCNKYCFDITLLSHVLVIVQALHAKFNTIIHKTSNHGSK
jgi:hypothetical protein